MALLAIYAIVIGPGIAAAYATITGVWTPTFAALKVAFNTQIVLTRTNYDFWTDIWFWYDINPTFQDMAQQLDVADSDQSRTEGSFEDALEQINNQQALQEQTLESHRTHRNQETTNCPATPLATGMVRSDRIRKAINREWPREQGRRGRNAVGTPGEFGAADEQEFRFNQYTSRYCNPNENGGPTKNPCVAAPTQVDMDIKVAEVLFTDDTIDVTDPETQQNVEDLVRNLVETEYVNPPIEESFNNPAGQNMILRRRALAAKRQAAYDAIYHVISRRVPGSDHDALVDTVRAQAGISGADLGLSANPSYDEVMNTMIRERFRTGQYALQLMDEPETVSREQVVLEAYRMMQMNDYIDLLDRFAVVLATEVAMDINEDANASTGSANQGGGAR